MHADATMARRWRRRVGGLLLHALVSGLPAAAAITLLVELFGWGSFAAIPGGPVIFACLVILFAAAIEAFAGKRHPRLYPLGLGRICFDHDLSTAEKFERLRRNPRVPPHLLAQLTFVSLLAMAVLSIG